MNNLFLESIDQTKLESIERIKKNKRFALKLHNHLDKIFKTNHKIVDKADSVTISMKTSERYNYYCAYGFQATEQGVDFFMKNFLVFSGNKILPLVNQLLGHEKSKSYGNKYDLYLSVNESDLDLNEKLKMIFNLMEYNKYNKRF